MDILSTIFFRRGSITLIFIILVGCGDKNAKCCDCLEASGKSDKYEYPLKPGMPEWANVPSDQIYNVCQIPEGVLKDMCPVGLVDSWFTYPLKNFVFVWPTPQEGIEKLTAKFNGLNSLLQTTNAKEILLKDYSEFDPSGYATNATIDDLGRYANDLFILELTIAQNKIIVKLSKDQRKALVAEALRKRILKDNDQIYNSLFNVSDAYIMSHVMIQDQYQPFINDLTDPSLIYFTQTCIYLYQANSVNPRENLTKILDHAKNYINN